MKRNFYLFVFALLLIIPIKAYANCSYANTAVLKNIASNVNYDYSYSETEQNVQFQIRFTNLNEKVYIYDVQNKKTYYNPTEKELVLINFNPGNQYKFEIKAYDSNIGSQTVTVKIIENGVWVDKTYVTGVTNSKCVDTIRTLYVNVPYYNKFYSDELCKGLESYTICQKWSNNDIDYNKFKSEIEKIKNTSKDKIVKNEKNDVSFSQIVIDFIIANYYLLIIFIVIIIAGVILLIKKRKKGFEGW